MRRTLLAAAVVATTITAPSVARAREDDVATAEALFSEANALVAAGKYAEACPKLAESQRIEPAVGTQFNLADCYEHLGRTATAFALYVDVARIARAAGKFERERVAKARAAELEPRLAHVRIVVQKPAPGLELKVDDSIAPREKWQAPIPVDPGDHHVVAAAPSRTPWEGSFTAKGSTTTDIAVPELVDPTPRVRTVATAETTPPSSTQRTVAIGIAGAGVAGVAVGTVAGLMALGARSSAEQACPEATYHFRCPTTKGTDDWNSATSAGNVSTVGFIVGAVALAGAAVLWFTAPSAKKRAALSGASLRFEGTF